MKRVLLWSNAAAFRPPAARPLPASLRQRQPAPHGLHPAWSWAAGRPIARLRRRHLELGAPDRSPRPASDPVYPGRVGTRPVGQTPACVHAGPVRGMASRIPEGPRPRARRPHWALDGSGPGAGPRPHPPRPGGPALPALPVSEPGRDPRHAPRLLVLAAGPSVAPHPYG